jgi:uncharacterized protein YfaP (DUF2135 family)
LHLSGATVAPYLGRKENSTVKTLIFCSVALGVALSIAPTPAARADNQAIVQILSATVRDQRIDGATIILQKNGEKSVATTTDTTGRAQVPNALSRDTEALLIVRREGYSDLVARCPCNGMTYAVSPFLTSLDGMRIVLNWGPKPDDLDGHLAFGLDHVFYQHKSGTDAEQDVDHLDGFGPETITVMRRHPDERYVYAVQDFTDKADPDTTNLSASDAKVFVYVGQTLIRSYYVPRNRTGNVWTVFAVSEAGEFQDINAMSGIRIIDTANLTIERVFGRYANPQFPTSSLTPAADDGPIPDSARRLNTQGETAYRQGDYPHAIELFQSAVQLHEGYGQAYSNLGLAFQKLGHVAEALWANRKAIALASGPSAAATRASTHFNNGRIYETAGQWNDALREYRSALSEKSSPVYQNAILRIRQQGAQ